MAVALKFGVDANGRVSYGANPPAFIYNAEITNGNAESHTLPSDEPFYTVNIRYQPGTVNWVDVTGTDAVAPSSSTFTSSTSQLNPSTLILPGGTEISVITSNSSSVVSMVIWAGGNA